MTATDNLVDRALVDRILGEYREMPGLALTPEQARRLWGCDGMTCRVAIEILVARGALHWSRDGRLVNGAAGSKE
ncbi:MAG TPA: hypothetical protein VJT13_02025 [Xanthobacteraceae bacterium]|jgi:hypothetical protein|nr:hypothetical protein [Xanthobacteraceae bacterium]